MTLFFQKLNKDSLWKRFSTLFQLVASTEYSLLKSVWCFLVLRLFKCWCASEEVKAWARCKESNRVDMFHLDTEFRAVSATRAHHSPCSANLLHDPPGMEANSPFHRGGTRSWFYSTGKHARMLMADGELDFQPHTGSRSTTLKFSTFPVFSVAALGFVHDESSQQRSGCPLPGCLQTGWSSSSALVCLYVWHRHLQRDSAGVTT